ncbi:methylmalonyl-CoA epimerase [Pedobacter yulinensis]|uniref:Methylmalonyl-CoA epimerase n=1 Tax=Pedobacter yulinensis TaxID=2126353 RepID=A0A2T3HI76_9SPHI|nr:methylmalonyl-CoA epimerase [Pedobacter yulinensis]PST82137.1 methylmalonyl-CoA epimerase [Pedobacter yulinensis]
MNKIEHIGIAVKSLEAAGKTYQALLGKSPYKTEAVVSEQVNTLFFETGDAKVELLEATGEESAIAKFIAKRGEGLHHIAFEVTDILAEMDRLRAEGFRLMNDQPKRGADNKLVCFVHPKDACGVLIELCQEAG